MADEEKEEAWTVVGRNNRPRRAANKNQPSKPEPAVPNNAAAAAAPLVPAAAAGDASAAERAPRLPGWGARPSKRPSADPPSAAAAQHKRPHMQHQQQEDERRPGRRREREAAAAAAGRRRRQPTGGGGGDDEGDDHSLERRRALHVRLVREVAAEVSRSGMFQSLRAAMASAGEGGDDSEDGEDGGEDGGGGGGPKRQPGGRGRGFPWSSVSEMVVYGLGSVESSRASRHQAALATLLASPELLPRVAEHAAEVAAASEAAAEAAAGGGGGGGGAGGAGKDDGGDGEKEDDADMDEEQQPAPSPPPQAGGLLAFDPCFSRADRAVLASLGVGVLAADERCRRRAALPAAFFYLPHLEGNLMDAVLDANWTRARLRRTAILANSFGRSYERWTSAPAALAAMAAAKAPRLHALVRAGAVREWPVPEGRSAVASAFNDAALHTFCGVSDAEWEAAGVPEGGDDEEEDE